MTRTQKTFVWTLSTFLALLMVLVRYFDRDPARNDLWMMALQFGDLVNDVRFDCV